MIKFSLKCGHDHVFDAWFRDGAAYDDQAAAGHIECPSCGDRSVRKAPMAPSIARSRGAKATSSYDEAYGSQPSGNQSGEGTATSGAAGRTTMSDAPATGGDTGGSNTGGSNTGGSNDSSQLMASSDRVRELLHVVKRHIEKNCDYVGDRFADEARRIHYGEADKRGIYGEASAEDAQELQDEGIEISQIPWPTRTDS